ncbi:MAG: hypothetical protein M3437_15345 [Chloroflexota bacterium]|nr:hypothetical protein [Chloroflexota bacterium]MDQ5865257.1 hypothetical protein [Chloroflexota bacterium]
MSASTAQSKSKLSHVAILALIVAGLAYAVYAAFMVTEWIADDPLRTDPPVSVETPLIYPGAQQVGIQRATNGDTIIVFKTEHKEDEVFRFYNNALTRDGWYRCESQYYTWGSCAPIDDGIIFQWTQAGFDGPTDLGYRLTVIADREQQPSNLTSIRLSIVRFDPRTVDPVATRYPSPYPPSVATRFPNLAAKTTPTS